MELFILAIILIALGSFGIYAGAKHESPVAAMSGAILLTVTTMFVTISPASASEYDIGANSNTRYGTLDEGRVQAGVVESVREVAVESTTTAQRTSTGLGALIGGALGAAAGKGNGKYITGAIGGVLGGIGGNMLGDKIASATAQEIIIRKGNGDLSVITQAESTLMVGQSVYLVESAGKVRVIPRSN